MKISNYKSLAILGRSRALSLAELESLYGSHVVEPFGEHCLLKLSTEDIDFSRLGGSVKIARLLAELPGDSWNAVEKYLIKKVPEHLKYLPPGKFTLGISVYGMGVDAVKVNNLAISIKKQAKLAGRNMRVVPNKSPELSSAQVLHNKLNRRGAWELLVVRGGQKTLLAQTIFVQDINRYSSRDQARPKRDSVVGMLPPKLAQIIINLSTPAEFIKSKQTVLDPFCGTGVILQEALLMGYKALGLDISPKMIDYTKDNLEWLAKGFGNSLPEFWLEVADATTQTPKKLFDFVASEIYLGPVLKGRATESAVKDAVSLTDKILEDFLKNYRQTNFFQMCLGVPCWYLDGSFVHLPTIDRINSLGYNRVSFVHTNATELIYHRPGQVVARELIVLRKQ